MLSALIFVCAATSFVSAQTTVFTYQGRLTDGGKAATANTANTVNTANTAMITNTIIKLIEFP